MNMRNSIINFCKVLFSVLLMTKDSYGTRGAKLSDLPVLKRWEVPEHHYLRGEATGRKYKELDEFPKRSSHWEPKAIFSANELDWDDDPEKIALDFNYKSFFEDGDEQQKEIHRELGILQKGNSSLVSETRAKRLEIAKADLSKRIEASSLHKNFSDETQTTGLAAFLENLKSTSGGYGDQVSKRRGEMVTLENAAILSSNKAIASGKRSARGPPVSVNHSLLSDSEAARSHNRQKIAHIQAKQHQTLSNSKDNKTLTFWGNKPRQLRHIIKKLVLKNKHISEDALTSRFRQRRESSLQELEFARRDIMAEVLKEARREQASRTGSLQTRDIKQTQGPKLQMLTLRRNPSEKLSQVVTLQRMSPKDHQSLQQKAMENSKMEAMKMLKHATLDKADHLLAENLKKTAQNMKKMLVVNIHKDNFLDHNTPAHLEKATAARIRNIKNNVNQAPMKPKSDLITVREKIDRPKEKPDINVIPNNVARAVAMAMEQLQRDKMWGKVFVHVRPNGQLKVMVQETRKMEDDN